jgi:hypothetical protein
MVRRETDTPQSESMAWMVGAPIRLGCLGIALNIIHCRIKVSFMAVELWQINATVYVVCLDLWHGSEPIPKINQNDIRCRLQLLTCLKKDLLRWPKPYTATLLKGVG